jgi:hypothetical protein
VRSAEVISTGAANCVLAAVMQRLRAVSVSFREVGTTARPVNARSAAMTAHSCRCQCTQVGDAVPDLAIADRHEFGLYGFRHRHSYALVRGFPNLDDEPGQPGTVLDLLFESVTRVSCRRDFSPLSLRYATPAELVALQRRVGGLRPLQRVYLLEPDTDGFVRVNGPRCARLWARVGRSS